MAGFPADLRRPETENGNVKGIRDLSRSAQNSLLFATLIGTFLAGAVTAISVGLGSHATTIVALIYVVVVLAASSWGGYAAGIAAALVAFLSLNFFFTPPVHTFRVASGTDAVALMVFLSVSIGVGLLLSRAVKEKAQAERRGRELRLINRLTTALLSGESLETVLPRFAEEINQTLRSKRCVITIVNGERIELGPATVDAGKAHEIPLVVRKRTVGRMRLWFPSGARPSPEEAQAAEAFARQLALALDGLRLRDEVRRVEMESRSNSLKATLFSGVTHDVKTPLAAITASVTSLLEGRGFTEAQSREHLEMIKQEAERMHRVVNNLLDLARLRAGAIAPRKAPSAVDELIDSVIARLRPRLESHEVLVDVADDLPEVPMDVVQIDQVLTNLVENAVKFSPPGGDILVSAKGDSKSVRVSVVDAGDGIERGEEQTLFEPFSSGSHPRAGTGLGLAIAKAIVVAHGGDIWVNRAPTGGAAFAFDLPVSQNGASD